VRQVRVARAEDAAAIAAIYAPIVRDTAISFEAEPPTEREMAMRMDKILPALPWLVMADGTRVLGYAYASPHVERAAYRWSANVSVYIHEAARGQGVGTGLYRSLLPILIQQGFRNAFAGIALPNAGSVALHQSLGFKPLGVYSNVGFKLGAWRDVGWWQLALNEGGDEPAEPVPFSQLRQTDQFGAMLA
jgi:phosphinothricin acetyltransferase